MTTGDPSDKVLIPITGVPDLYIVAEVNHGSSIVGNYVPGLGYNSVAVSQGTFQPPVETQICSLRLEIEAKFQQLLDEYNTLKNAHESLLADFERLRDLVVITQIGMWESGDYQSWVCSCGFHHKHSIASCAMCGQYRPSKAR